MSVRAGESVSRQCPRVRDGEHPVSREPAVSPCVLRGVCEVGVEAFMNNAG